MEYEPIEDASCLLSNDCYLWDAESWALGVGQWTLATERYRDIEANEIVH